MGCPHNLRISVYPIAYYGIEITIKYNHNCPWLLAVVHGFPHFQMGKEVGKEWLVRFTN